MSFPRLRLLHLNYRAKPSSVHCFPGLFTSLFSVMCYVEFQFYRVSRLLIWGHILRDIGINFVKLKRHLCPKPPVPKESFEGADSSAVWTLHGSLFEVPVLEILNAQSLKQSQDSYF